MNRIFFGLWKLSCKNTRLSKSLLTVVVNDMASVNYKVHAAEDRKKFEQALPSILQHITGPRLDEINDAVEHFTKSVQYNLQGGKMTRGLTVISTWRRLVGDQQATEEGLQSAIVLAWCVELLQASFLVADDVMDQSKTRRGKPCWYKMEDIGLVAVNDALMLEGGLYNLVDRYFFDKKCYANITRILHRTTFQTEMGQTIDLITKPGKDFINFTLERYKAIVKWKTAFYSFYLPVALAMYLVDITDQKLHDSAKEILLQIGEYFQIQDDYLDCYGDPEVTGKVGTDIEDTKCSWLLVQALQRVDSNQLEIIKENYGKDDSRAVARVKEVYKQLDIVSVYNEYEEESYKKLMKQITEAPVALPKEIFIELTEKLYKRKK